MEKRDSRGSLGARRAGGRLRPQDSVVLCELGDVSASDKGLWTGLFDEAGSGAFQYTCHRLDPTLSNTTLPNCVDRSLSRRRRGDCVAGAEHEHAGEDDVSEVAVTREHDVDARQQSRDEDVRFENLQGLKGRFSISDSDTHNGELTR